MIEATKNAKGHKSCEKLWEAIRNEWIPFSFIDFRLLLVASYIEEIENSDEKVRNIKSLKGIFGIDCFDYLAEIYPGKCRLFRREDSIELIVFPFESLFA